MAYRVLVVDDDPDYRLIVSLALEGHPVLRVVGEAETAEDGVAMAAGLHPDLVLFDLLLVGREGRAVLAELSRVAPHATVLATSAFSGDAGDVWLRSGPLIGHISKSVPPSRLPQEILLLAGTLDAVEDALDVAAARLAPELPSAARARRFVEETLGDWECEDMLDTVKLLVSELVGNALAHARSDVEVVVRLLPDGLRIEVADESADWVRRRSTDDVSISGRGIDVVEALADSWGVTPRRGGKAVWFELARPLASEGAGDGDGDGDGGGGTRPAP